MDSQRQSNRLIRHLGWISEAVHSETANRRKEYFNVSAGDKLERVSSEIFRHKAYLPPGSFLLCAQTGSVVGWPRLCHVSCYTTLSNDCILTDSESLCHTGEVPDLEGGVRLVLTACVGDILVQQQTWSLPVHPDHSGKPCHRVPYKGQLVLRE